MSSGAVLPRPGSGCRLNALLLLHAVKSADSYLQIQIFRFIPSDSYLQIRIFRFVSSDSDLQIQQICPTGIDDCSIQISLCNWYFKSVIAVYMSVQHVARFVFFHEFQKAAESPVLERIEVSQAEGRRMCHQYIDPLILPDLPPEFSDPSGHLLLRVHVESVGPVAV